MKWWGVRRSATLWSQRSQVQRSPAAMLKQLMKPLTPLCRLAASCFIHCFPAAVEWGVSLWLWGYCRLEPLQGVLFILTFSHCKKKRRKRGQGQWRPAFCCFRQRLSPGPARQGQRILQPPVSMDPLIWCAAATPSPMPPAHHCGPAHSRRADVKRNVRELRKPKGTVFLSINGKYQPICVRRCYVSTDTMQRRKQRVTRNKSPLSEDALTQRHPFIIRNGLKGS